MILVMKRLRAYDGIIIGRFHGLFALMPLICRGNIHVIDSAHYMLDKQLKFHTIMPSKHISVVYCYGSYSVTSKLQKTILIQCYQAVRIL